MSEHPKAIIALQLANASVLVVNSENLHAMRGGLLAMKKAIELLIREKGVAEARHAEEMRELKERFSEAAYKATQAAIMSQPAQVASYLTPFIIPTSDPLESWLHSSGYEGNSVVEQALADITKSGGKIVWEAGE